MLYYQLSPGSSSATKHNKIFVCSKKKNKQLFADSDKIWEERPNAVKIIKQPFNDKYSADEFKWVSKKAIMVN